MSKRSPDPGLDTLVELNGQTFFLDEGGSYWVKFEVRRCQISPEHPHGLRYSLTLHGPNGERLVGYDNAHAAPRSKPRRRLQAHDHKHRLRTVKPYEYSDAASLLGDFWKDVDAVLKEKGVLK